MSRVRSRRTLASRGLSESERYLLLTGHVYVGWGDAPPFGSERGRLDRAAIRRAWRKHRDELLADAARRGLIPWAARELEGMPGAVSHYEHLRRS